MTKRDYNRHTVLSSGERMKGDDLRQWLEDYGYSQRDFARIVGVNERSVRGWLFGDRNVPAMIPIVLQHLELQDTGEEIDPQDSIVTVTETMEYERVIEAESDLSLNDFIEQVRRTAELWNNNGRFAFAINGVRYELTEVMIPRDENFHKNCMSQELSVREYTDDDWFPEPLNESVYREYQARYDALIAKGKK